MSKKQSTEITVEKFHELVNKQISKLETKIDRTYEKYPYDAYGLKADNMVDPIRDDIRRLKELKKGVQSADALRAELERTKGEKAQLKGALAEALNALDKYDPGWAQKIQKRWRV